MSERCYRCDKTMLQEDYDAEHATIHIGTSSKHTNAILYFGDNWYLLCHDCLADWREKFGGWLRGDVE